MCKEIYRHERSTFLAAQIFPISIALVSWCVCGCQVAAVLLLARDGSQVAEAIKLLAASKVFRKSIECLKTNFRF